MVVSFVRESMLLTIGLMVSGEQFTLMRLIRLIGQFYMDTCQRTMEEDNCEVMVIENAYELKHVYSLRSLNEGRTSR